jgi:hypothetical protein
VERDGISFGGMNKILLQKIEELTPYVLQASNHAKKQDKEIYSYAARDFYST